MAYVAFWAPPRRSRSAPGWCSCCSAAGSSSWRGAAGRRRRLGSRRLRSCWRGGRSPRWPGRRFKVGALSYGGGFVIIPLMQADAVDTYGWMTDAEFANAVAYGQLTPGPVVQTVAMVGWAAAGLGGALLASAIAFAPSFIVVAALGDRFVR